MSGWIKIHRAITDHWLYTEKRVFSRFEAWNDILLMVNYTDAKTIIKGKLYDIKRGQSILSLDSWAKRWNWDKSKVRRFLELLQKEKMIELKSDTITTHLIVCNYASYQGDRHTNDTRTTRKRNADETQTTPIEEEEEREEEKESNKFVTPTRSQVVEYFIEKGYKPEAGEKAFEYYSVANWKDAKGDKVKNWKQKMTAVWFKPENKIITKVEPERDEFGFKIKKSVMHT